MRSTVAEPVVEPEAKPETQAEPLTEPASESAQEPAEDTETVPPAAGSQRERGLLYYAGLGASAALLLAVLALALILIVVPRIAGATPLTVLTASMEPRYPPGTLIYVLPVKAADIKIGDVITYQIQSGNPAVISHRVIAINSQANGKRTFILKGDNNAVPDPAAVIPAQIKGRLWYAIPLLGWVNSALNGSKRPWIVDVIAGALFVYAGYMIIAGIVAASKARKKKRTEVGTGA